MDRLIETIIQSINKNIKPNGFSQRAYILSCDIRSFYPVIRTKNQIITFCLNLAKRFFHSIESNSILLVPVFNFDFISTKFFDPQNSRCQVGAFGQILLDSKIGNRTLDPIYSFLIMSKIDSGFCDTPFRCSAGNGSVFDILLKLNPLLISIGHHYAKSLTIIHHSEALNGAHYRYFKKIKGKLFHNNIVEDIEYNYYARKSDICTGSGITNYADGYFRNKNIIKSQYVHYDQWGSLIHITDLKSLHEILTSHSNKKELILDYYGPTRNMHNVFFEKADDKFIVELKKEKIRIKNSCLI